MDPCTFEIIIGSESTKGQGRNTVFDISKETGWRYVNPQGIKLLYNRENRANKLTDTYRFLIPN